MFKIKYKEHIYTKSAVSACMREREGERENILNLHICRSRGQSCDLLNLLNFLSVIWCTF